MSKLFSKLKMMGHKPYIFFQNQSRTEIDFKGRKKFTERYFYCSLCQDDNLQSLKVEAHVLQKCNFLVWWVSRALQGHFLSFSSS